ncbi:hypothetical protein D9M69_716150 [compost metagenome]
MRDLGERAAFLEEALEAEAVQGQLLGRHLRQQFARRARRQRRRQVFLDGDLLAFVVHREVDDAKAAGGQLPHDQVSADDRIRRQRRRFQL